MSFENIRYKVPAALLYSRLLFCLIILFLALSNYSYDSLIVIVLLYTGIVTDIFDGIIARKLNVSTPNFRLLDTLFDLFFYVSILFFVNSKHNDEVQNNLNLILVLFMLEGSMYGVSWFRFGKLPSPHAVLSKFWGLYLVIEFTLILSRVEGTHFTIALLIGLFVHVDRLLIYVLLKQWDHDIPSSYHALLLRQGKQIRRRRLFNG